MSSVVTTKGIAALTGLTERQITAELGLAPGRKTLTREQARVVVEQAFHNHKPAIDWPSDGFSRPTRPGSGFDLQVNQPKVRAEYDKFLAELKDPYTSWDIYFVLGRVHELGKTLGLRPLPPAFEKEVKKRADMQMLLKSIGRANIARGSGNYAMELKSIVFDAKQMNMSGRELAQHLSAHGIKPADIERYTDYVFAR